MIFSIKKLQEKQEIPQIIQDKFASKARAQEYYISRLALFDCLKQKKTVALRTNAEDLRIVNNLYLELFPEILASISHTQNFGAAVIADCNKYRSIGIDIELKSRTINPQVEKYFINQSDSLEDQQDIFFSWIKKEAAFKAVSPLHTQFTKKSKLILKDIWLNNSQFGIVGKNNPIGTTSTLTKTIEKQEIVIALAFITL